jgi:hypothetical protein
LLVSFLYNVLSISPFPPVDYHDQDDLKFTISSSFYIFVVVLV